MSRGPGRQNRAATGMMLGVGFGISMDDLAFDIGGGRAVGAGFGFALRVGLGGRRLGKDLIQQRRISGRGSGPYRITLRCLRGCLWGV